MWKKCKVVMLPAGNQHLYILSDDEIKESSWCYCSKENRVIKNEYHTDIPKTRKKIIATTDKLKTIDGYINYQGDNLDEPFPNYVSLSQIPQSFIEQFTSSYNEGKIISEVMVEYDEEELYTRNIPRAGLKPENRDIWVSLKTNPDNTINIKTVKDSFSRDEVIELLKEFNDRFGTLGLVGDFRKHDLPKFNKWIEENL